MRGAGAAGGIGFAALLAPRRVGVEVVVDLVRLRHRLVGAGPVIDDEGSSTSAASVCRPNEKPW
ncbi:glycerate kinase [Mycolicibacterium brisbanense]